jgi:hypothetical protein
MTYILVHGEARSEILTIALGTFKSFEWHAPWCNRVQLSPIVESNQFKHIQQSWKARLQVKPERSSNLWIVSPITGGGADRGDGK